jgi:hypothetical protein
MFGLTGRGNGFSCFNVGNHARSLPEGMDIFNVGEWLNS